RGVVAALGTSSVKRPVDPGDPFPNWQVVVLPRRDRKPVVAAGSSMVKQASCTFPRPFTPAWKPEYLLASYTHTRRLSAVAQAPVIWPGIWDFSVSSQSAP